MTYIKREYRVRYTKTLSLFFLCDFEKLINLFKYNILNKILEFEDKFLKKEIIVKYKSNLN